MEVHLARIVQPPLLAQFCVTSSVVALRRPLGRLRPNLPRALTCIQIRRPDGVRWLSRGLAAQPTPPAGPSLTPPPDLALSVSWPCRVVLVDKIVIMARNSRCRPGPDPITAIIPKNFRVSRYLLPPRRSVTFRCGRQTAGRQNHAAYLCQTLRHRLGATESG